MVDVAENLGLWRVPLGPGPFLLKISIELIRVLHTLDIAARSWIPVPVPGPAHVGTGFETLHSASERPQLVDHIEASKPGADNDSIFHRQRLVTGVRRVRTRKD